MEISEAMLIFLLLPFLLLFMRTKISLFGGRLHPTMAHTELQPQKDSPSLLLLPFQVGQKQKEKEMESTS